MFDTDSRSHLQEASSDVWWPEGVTDETSNGDVGGIPAGLDDMEPGPELAAVLAGIDVESLTGYDMVTVLKAQERLVSHQNAQLYRTMALP